MGYSEFLIRANIFFIKLTDKFMPIIYISEETNEERLLL